MRSLAGRCFAATREGDQHVCEAWDTAVLLPTSTTNSEGKEKTPSTTERQRREASDPSETKAGAEALAEGGGGRMSRESSEPRGPAWPPSPLQRHGRGGFGSFSLLHVFACTCRPLSSFLCLTRVLCVQLVGGQLYDSAFR